MKTNSFFKPKQTIFFFICCAAMVIILIAGYTKLAFEEVTPIAQKQEKVERGSIVDRLGFPLAVQANFYHVGVSVKNLRDNQKQKERFSQDIAPLLGMDDQYILELISNAKSFVYLKKKIDQSSYEQIKQMTDEKGYNFVSYEQVAGRNYPNHSLASQLIGFMGDDGNGLAGIEFSMQEILSPKESDDTQKTPLQKEAESQNGDSQKNDETQDDLENLRGRNIYLTIDANLQYKLEQIAQKTMQETQAEAMMLIAADSQTGEVLSYISYPSADLNDYGLASESARIDRPAMEAYEPGSVFKIFTVGIVYDERGIKADESFLCDGMYEKRLASGETIRIKCLEHHGYGTAKDALRFSCNDMIGQISDRISEERFMERIRLLGFGEKTNVELPGETLGFVKDVNSSSWSARSKPTIAIGQEIQVSALQMVQAATAIANGGVPVKLSFINKITNKDGSIYYEHTPEYKDRVFSKATADYVLSCMETTAKTGTGSRANLRDVDIGVKTGTAQVYDTKTKSYSDTDFISSCMAIFPVDNPEIILYIVVEKAKGETYGGRIVAPVIGEAADTIIDHLGMSRGGAASLEHTGIITFSQSQPLRIGSTVPDFVGKSKKELLPLLERDDIKLNINGSGWVVSQSPEPGELITENMVIELNLE